MSVFFKRRGDAPETFVVSNSFTHCSSSNPATSVLAGKSYMATLTMESGYNTLSVTVTMSGVDITASVYSSGMINIEAVTGDVVISAVASSIDFRTWYINETPSLSNFATQINFTSNGRRYTEFRLMNLAIVRGLSYLSGSSETSVYFVTLGVYKWEDENFRTVTFDVAPTDTLRTWLEANATPI